MNKFLLSVLLCCASFCALYAQDTTFFQIRKTITLGFQTGVQFNKYPNQYLNNKTSKYQYTTTNRLLATKKITHHFDIATGINYAVVPMGNRLGNTRFKRYNNHINQLSIPLTLQYNFLPETKRIRPYIAAGGIYDVIKISAPSAKPVYTDGNVPAMQSRSIGAILTQGVIFEVNTKIQFNECIHFMQANKCKSLGIDLGVGYKL